jgi:hypothetical protein
MPFRWWAEEGPRTQLRPDAYLEWSNSEINTTGRNDVPAEPVRIEVRRWLRSGGLRDGGLRRWERCLRGRIYWRDLSLTLANLGSARESVFCRVN